MAEPATTAELVNDLDKQQTLLDVGITSLILHGCPCLCLGGSCCAVVAAHNTSTKTIAVREWKQTDVVGFLTQLLTKKIELLVDLKELLRDALQVSESAVLLSHRCVDSWRSSTLNQAINPI